MGVRKIAIVGAGESGVGAAILAKEKNYEVFVSDYGEIQNKYKDELIKYKIPFEEGGHSFEKLEQADWLVKSPGVPSNLSWLLDLHKKGVIIMSEIEFAFRHMDGKIVGITGSNGKTTTTSLIYHLLTEGGVNCGLAGNIGQSFARMIVEEHRDWWVLEISSFQLDDCIDFKADIAVLLNITPDHLDAYENNFDRYAESKFRIAENQSADDAFIINASDEVIMTKLKDRNFKQQIIKVDYPKAGDRNIESLDGSKFDMSSSKLKGRHNLLNAAIAVEVTKVFGIKDKIIQKALESFNTIAHRMERVAVIDGVEFINDSKATNVDAVFFALECIDKPLIWIAGGTDKGNDYRSLLKLVSGKVKLLICLCEEPQKLIDSFRGIVPKILHTKEMIEAVSASFEEAMEGDIVLLSPACASFDLFDNYIDRGNKFKKAVWSLLN